MTIESKPAQIPLHHAAFVFLWSLLSRRFHRFFMRRTGLVMIIDVERGLYFQAEPPWEIERLIGGIKVGGGYAEVTERQSEK